MIKTFFCKRGTLFGSYDDFDCWPCRSELWHSNRSSLSLRKNCRPYKSYVRCWTGGLCSALASAQLAHRIRVCHNGSVVRSGSVAVSPWNGCSGARRTARSNEDHALIFRLSLHISFREKCIITNGF